MTHILNSKITTVYSMGNELAVYEVKDKDYKYVGIRTDIMMKGKEYNAYDDGVFFENNMGDLIERFNRDCIARDFMNKGFGKYESVAMAWGTDFETAHNLQLSVEELENK